MFTRRSSGSWGSVESKSHFEMQNRKSPASHFTLAETLERRTLFNSVPVVGPMVISAQFDASTAPHAIHVQFTDDVSASLDGSDLVVINELARVVIPSELMTVNWDASTFTATFIFARLDDGGILPEGRWHATLLGDGIFNSDGFTLDGDADAQPGGDYSFDFHFLLGDANHDAVVDLKDFNAMAGNFGQTARNFDDGDFNYDGVVNLADVNIFASRFGTSLIGGGGSSLGPSGLSADNADEQTLAL